MIRYEVGAAFTKCDRSTGLKGIVNDLERHNDTLYAATTNAVYRLRTVADTIGSFEPVSGGRRHTKSTPGWTLLSRGGGTTVWFGMWENRILRHVPGSGRKRNDVPTCIYRVVEHETDSALAVHGASEATTGRPRTGDGVQFTYGAPSLVRPSSVEYQYRMRGADETWSEWTSRTTQTCRTLGPGDHTFSVRARLAYGDTPRPPGLR